MKTYSFVIFVIIYVGLSLNVFAQNGLTVIFDTVVDHINAPRTDMLCDPLDNIWSSYKGKGVCRFQDGITTVYKAGINGLASNTVFDLFLDDNMLYAATENGISYCNVLSDNILWNTVEASSGTCTHAIYIEAGVLYALCGDNYSVNEALILDLTTGVGSYNPIQQVSALIYKPFLFADNGGNIYWSHYSQGLYRYNQNSGSELVDSFPGIRQMTKVGNSIYYSGSQGFYSWNCATQTKTNGNEYSYYDEILYYKNVTILEYSTGQIAFLPFGCHDGPAFTTISESETETYTYADLDTFNISDKYFVAINSENEIIVSGFSDRIYNFNPDDYINILTGYSGENFKFFDKNKVKAGVKSYGTLFNDGAGDPEYAVPVDSATHTIFSMSLWVGGYDENDLFHFSGEKFNQYGHDYFPGPLAEYGEYGSCETSVCEYFNRVWKVNRDEIMDYSDAYNGSDTMVVPVDIAEWPGTGPQGYELNLAPYIDNNGDGLYNPADGDVPDMIGDQMLWWVTNDSYMPHTETDTLPMGLEIQHTLYGYTWNNPPNETADLINYQTFLRLKITNRSQHDYDSVFFGLFVDGDLGCPTDDYVGCDVELQSFYFYNGDDFDEDFQGNHGFGAEVPIQTITLLETPMADQDYLDNDNDSIVDNEHTGMSKFMYFNNSGGLPAMQGPSFSETYYNYMRGFWGDGQPLYYGGSGHPSGGGDTGIPCSYMAPGDTDPDFTGTGGIPVGSWTEEGEDNPPDDRRGLCSMGPISFLSGEETEIVVLLGFIPHGNAKSTGRFDYRPSLDTLVQWYHTNTIPSEYMNTESVQSNNDSPSCKIWPNPASDRCIVTCEEIVDNIRLVDINGRVIFESYVGSNYWEFDCVNLEPGIYIVELYGKAYKSNKKLIIR
jgi:hypothetical protein